MSKIGKFYSDLPEHSQVKVRLLTLYLTKYINTIANDRYTRSIHIYDLFCGEGIYANGAKGSPLMILDVVTQIIETYTENGVEIPHIYLVFNDKDKRKTDKLKSIIESMDFNIGRYCTIKIISQDYTELVPSIVKQINQFSNEKAFVFIDPNGYSEISCRDLQNMLNTNKSEVLLFLPTQHMYRFSKKGTPQSLIRLLDELIDIEQWKISTSAYDFIQQLTNALRTFLGTRYFVDTFTIEKDPQTMYCLFFFSSHIRGFEKMLEAKWEIDSEQGRGYSYEKSIGLFASLKIDPLADKLQLWLKECVRHNGEVYEFGLQHGFLPKHVNEVLTDWQEHGLIEVRTEDGKAVRKKAFYINYDNSLKKPMHRVFFHIKG
ncbi:MAG: three-Cys-motif partner protein TcmP [Candidatus Kapaibacterium sp.]